ncbi:tagatose 1,6-diphosphate aldolase [Jannaschia pagri]|uniref:Tagatose 1,6-diphosphate aldolase n=1 Tax=Jannaschia pagri TaxID=2829797 RepID=A0ABQ4NKM8_9RHOB|nr:MULTISPECIES: tagatose 1,6-diphosphate aldolase [unclassified Jannaschia]GIT91136.1 tagatose 1,6-diphosphate aldolase [Jannaschia sp. AI_61]GIT94968.1 tagatose 1,6-diphosphate aldolase [Jannaschia sp. AI_62]
MTLSLTPGKQLGFRRMSDAAGRFKMTAVDQRPPIKGPIAAAHGGEAPWEKVAEVKTALMEALQPSSTAMLLDPHYAIPHGWQAFDPRKGLIVTLEDSLFRDTGQGRFSAEIDDWSVGKIKRMGGDAVKVLAWFRPDISEEVRVAQEDFVKRTGDLCAALDIPFLFELLVHPVENDAEQTSEYTEMATKHSDHVLRSVEHFAGADYGVDVFKLESPVPAKGITGGDRAVQDLFDEMGRLAARPWVMLSAGAGKGDFKTVLDYAYAAGASGYLAGRAIWLDAFNAWPDMEAMKAGLVQESMPYMAELNALTDAKATPWHAHPAYGGAGLAFVDPSAGFRHGYGDIL